MKELKHKIPTWVTSGKTIRELVEELQSFENQDLEIRLSLDDGDTHKCISTVSKAFNEDGSEYCILKNSESYHENEWQDFMDENE